MVQSMNERTNSGTGISGSTLKLIAIICMLIDHIGAGLVFYDIAGGQYLLTAGDRATELAIYYWLRRIGRTAFPIFCYQVVEGFFHTRSRARYLLNMFVFAIFSEIPFDLGLTFKRIPVGSGWVSMLKDHMETAWTAQNVFWTLALGLTAIWLIHTILNISEGKGAGTLAAGFAASCGVLTVISLTAQKLHTDYRWYGVCLITIFFIFYRYREKGMMNPALQKVLGCAAGYPLLGQLNMEWWSLPGFELICLASGKRGFLGRSRWKYAFYFFYPAHLILIYCIRCVLFGG